MRDYNLLIKICESEETNGSCANFTIDSERLKVYIAKHGKVGIRDLLTNVDAMRRETDEATMRVLAVPKVVFEKMVAEDKAHEKSHIALVSVLDHFGCNDRILENDNERHLTLWFDDIHPTTTMTIASCIDCKAMDFKDAKRLIEFIKGLPSDVETIIVHCTAGICRSGAIVDFLRVILDVDDIWFAQNNSRIIPNEWVRDLLWMTWRMKGSL